jgi:uncharacterized surface protein with fasciclin (FAS1) repeats
MATIVQIMNADPNLSLFSKGVRVLGMEEKLNEIGPFTMLAPVNLALNNMFSKTYDQLLQPTNRAEFLHFLSGFILTGKKMYHDFRNNQMLQSLNGDQITVNIKNGDTLVNGAKILARNRQGSNGVIHLLDKTYALVETK